MPNKLVLRVVGIIIIIINVFFSFLFFSEFYRVGIYKKENSAYPFGIDDGLYKSAETYAMGMLIRGFIFFIPLIFLIYFLVHFKRKPALMFSIILFSIDFLFLARIVN